MKNVGWIIVPASIPRPILFYRLLINGSVCDISI